MKRAPTNEGSGSELPESTPENFIISEVGDLVPEDSVLVSQILAKSGIAPDTFWQQEVNNGTDLISYFHQINKKRDDLLARRPDLTDKANELANSQKGERLTLSIERFKSKLKLKAETHEKLFGLGIAKAK